MEAVREITVWTGINRQPNHDYLLEGDRVMAYRKWGEGEVIPCSGNIKLNRRGRKFEKLEPNPFKGFDTANKEPMVLEVQGSKGAVYRVDVEAKTCTCPGFTFRGNCKHTAALEIKLVDKLNN
jgi:hypothetical protein